MSPRPKCRSPIVAWDLTYSFIILFIATYKENFSDAIFCGEKYSKLSTNLGVYFKFHIRRYATDLLPAHMCSTNVMNDIPILIAAISETNKIWILIRGKYLQSHHLILCFSKQQSYRVCLCWTSCAHGYLLQRVSQFVAGSITKSRVRNEN